MGTFRNTSSPLKLYEITTFHTGSLGYGFVYESAESYYADDAFTSNVCHGFNIYCRDLKFIDIVPNTIIIIIKNKKLM